MTAVEHDGDIQGAIERMFAEVERGRGAHDTIVLPLPNLSPAALRDVRSTVLAVLSQALPADESHEVQLVCSELVTNAVEHGEPPVRLLLHERPGEIVVAVFDGGPGPAGAGDTPTSGLRIVAELTDGRWGSHRERHGTWVWAVLPHEVRAPRRSG
jgi:two-component sensor histidine kinase